jgi:NAD(P)-dependent dehydrogenase (short-subunit alcohol dehydrogenase family)
MRLPDKKAVITGAGRGIGRQIALRFAAEGAHVVIADLQIEDARAVAAEITAVGGQAVAAHVDVGDPVSVQRMIEAASAAFGPLDVLVNNAGVGLNKPFLTTTQAEWDHNLRVNLTGTFLCGQAAARVMVAHGGGRIINIASISGQRGGIGRSAYGASKGGVIALTKIMAVELAPLQVRVNAVAPGPVDTDQSRATHTVATRRSYLERIPMNRYGTADEIASGVVFLASDDSGFVTGHVLNVDGGFNSAGLMFDADA